MTQTLQPNNQKIAKSQRLFNKAVTQYQKGDLLKTELNLKKAIQLAPGIAEYFHFLGLVKQQQGNNLDAILSIKKATLLDNSNPDYFYNLGIILKMQDKNKEALKNQKIALALAPKNIHYINEASLLLIELNQLAEAKKYIDISLRINKNHAATYVNLSFISRKENNFKDAIKYATQALLISPNLQPAQINLGKSYLAINQIKEGVSLLKKTTTQNSSLFSDERQSILMHLLYSDDYTPNEIYQEHAIPNKTPLKKTKPNKNRRTRTSKINIGFMSSDFNNHSIFHFLISILENYNTSKFNFFCYSGVANPDNHTKIIQNHVDFWRDINTLNETKIIAQIKKDKIDILIDLAGHSQGGYLNIFDKKPASIQVTFLGYPFSSGLTTMDYRIVDSLTDPVGASENIHSETLIRLDPCFICYKQRENLPTTSKIPFDKNHRITFGSFNNFKKLSPTILRLWAKIIRRTPKSRLILKNNYQIPNLLAEKIRNIFLEENVSDEQLIICQPKNKILDHMKQYNDIDICLDSFPYNGTTTTFEALSMGVPVISLSGNIHHSRVGNTILKNLGLSELIAMTEQEYIDKAVSLASQPNMIKTHRTELPKRLNNSVLTDAKLYTNAFQEILNQIFEQHGERSF